jgi:RNA-directed DNA polymerase
MPEDAGVDVPALRQGPHGGGSRVREIQAKLHRWARTDPGFRFDDLYNLVCDPATLAMAWDRVAGNKGARTAGVDRYTVRDIAERVGVEAFLAQIRDQLRARTFRPLPVRERTIPKYGGKLRKLGIPAVADRVVQAALKLVLRAHLRGRLRTGLLWVPAEPQSTRCHRRDPLLCHRGLPPGAGCGHRDVL